MYHSTFSNLHARLPDPTRTLGEKEPDIKIKLKPIICNPYL